MKGIKLEYQYEDSSPHITMELDRDSTTVEVGEAFVSFMKASGYASGSIYRAMWEIGEEGLDDE